MRHGWTIAFCGWQWDAPKPGPRIGIKPPQVPPRARNPDGNMHLRIQPNEVTAAYPLTDHHVGSIGQHRPIPTRDVADAGARLLVRPSMYGEAQEIPRDRWRFARDEVGTAVSDPEWVRLEGGFQPGLVYRPDLRPARLPSRRGRTAGDARPRGVSAPPPCVAPSGQGGSRDRRGHLAVRTVDAHLPGAGPEYGRGWRSFL